MVRAAGPEIAIAMPFNIVLEAKRGECLLCINLYKIGASPV